MNLSGNTTIDELKQLVSQCNDNAGHHVLWVSQTGDVNLDTIPASLSPVGFERSKTPDMIIRYETFIQGNDYVGPNAANDDTLMTRLFGSLQKEWANSAKIGGSGRVVFVDRF